MAQLLLQCATSPLEGCCRLCCRSFTATPGIHLVCAENLSPVCPDCGRSHAPLLMSLVYLADVAQRVGQIGRHTVFPPLTALLELARAAEQYTSLAAPGSEGDRAALPGQASPGAIR